MYTKATTYKSLHCCFCVCVFGLICIHVVALASIKWLLFYVVAFALCSQSERILGFVALEVEQVTHLQYQKSGGLIPDFSGKIL